MDKTNGNIWLDNPKPTQLEHAIAWLGDHYVFHKDNQVKKFKRPVPLCSDPRFLIERLKGRL